MNANNKYYLRYLLWLLDILAIVAAFTAGTYIRFHNFIDMRDKSQHFMVCIIFALMCTIYTFALDYNRDFVRRGPFQEMTAVCKYLFVITIGTLIAIYATKLADAFSRLVMGYFVILAFILTLAFHLGLRFFLKSYWEIGETASKVLLLTEESVLGETVRNLKDRLDINCKLVGIVCLDGGMIGNEIEGIPVIADQEDILDVVTPMPLDEVFIHTPNYSQKKLNDIISAFSDMGVAVHYCVELPSVDGQSSVGMFGGYSVISYRRGTERYRGLIIKRLFDILGGLVGTILTLIMLPFITIAIKIDDPGPVFFSQLRIGRNGRRFKIYKFRSMYTDAEARKAELMKQNEMKGLMFKMKDDPRITKVGAFLRKTSLDEFPQFLNILKGDMSLVGTRPPTEKEFEQYNQYYRRRISMTPGLTGMWQVSGRSDIDDFDEIVRLDLQYIDNWSLGLDLKILLKTFGVVLFGKGAS